MINITEPQILRDQIDVLNLSKAMADKSTRIHPSIGRQTTHSMPYIQIRSGNSGMMNPRHLWLDLTFTQQCIPAPEYQILRIASLAALENSSVYPQLLCSLGPNQCHTYTYNTWLQIMSRCYGAFCH